MTQVTAVDLLDEPGINTAVLYSFVAGGKSIMNVLLYLRGRIKGTASAVFVIQHRKAVPLFLVILPFMHLRIQQVTYGMGGSAVHRIQHSGQGLKNSTALGFASCCIVLPTLPLVL